MNKHYLVEQRERAVKMVMDHLDDYQSVYAACQVIGPMVGIGCESLRRCVLQAQLDANQRPATTSAEQQRIKELEREVRDLEEANEILKAASAFFMEQVELEGSKLRVSAVGFGCAGLMQSPSSMGLRSGFDHSMAIGT